MTRCPAGQNRDQSRRFGRLLLVLLTSVMVLCLGITSAADAQQTVITSTGPMTQISLGDDLSCQVQMANDAAGVFFTGSVPGACGTFLQIGPVGNPPFAGDVFGPSVPAGDPPVTWDYVPDPQHPQTLTGNGTAGSPYTVTTTADACTGGMCSAGNGSMAAVLTETDSYVVGDDFYTTSLAINDVSDFALSGTLYHTGDCFLEGDAGYGALAGVNAPECALSPNDSPAGRVVSFIPGAGPSPSGYYEGAFDSFWTDITTTGTPYPDTIDATTFEDNGLGLSWPYSVGSGGTTTINYTTLISPAQALANTAAPAISGTPAVGQTLTCSQGSWSGSGPITYTYQWLQDTNPIGGETNNTYVVQTGDQGHSLTCQVTADNGIGSPVTQTSASVNVPSAPVLRTAPSVLPQPPTVNQSQGAGFSAAVNPDGSATTVYFEYGLDPKYGLTTASSLYVQRTPNQVVGAGSAPQVVIATVTGLVPHALYHVRVVASNPAGSVKGSDQTFTTTAIAPPPPPVLGRQANFAPSAGVVYIKPPSGAHIAALQANPAASPTAKTSRGRGFVPLTQALQLPVGTQVDARNGTLKVTTATTAKKPGKRTQTQSGEFSKGLFQVLQSGKGKLKGTTVLELLDSGIFPGAPSYKTECGAVGKLTRQTGQSDGQPVFRRRRLSNRALQTLLASEHGNYRTQGRYSAATVRGTVFTVTDRCDGTLTHVVHGTVVVADYHRHRNITVHAGHQYLAKAP
jgi:hypothetical protein